MKETFTIGRSAPLGATLIDGGVNFSLYCRDGTRVELLLFDRVDDARPARVIALPPETHRTYHYWHVAVPGLTPGQLYAYRVDGPFDPSKGMRFDSTKVLLDPYGRGAAVPRDYSRAAACRSGDNAAAAMKSVVTDPRAYDWEGDAPPRTPSARSIVYEMHVRGFTRHPSSGVDEKKRGTYAGLIEKIPYLQELGITAVELLPVFQFDSRDCPPGRVNYWGYQPVSYFAPHAAYSHDAEWNWLDWSLLEKHRDVHRFVSLLSARRLLRDIEHERRRTSLTELIARANKAWHGIRLNQPDWGDNSLSVALQVELRNEGHMLHWILNSYISPLDFELPPMDNGRKYPWRRWIDTSLDSPHDITEFDSAPPVPGMTYRAQARSVAVLWSPMTRG